MPDSPAVLRGQLAIGDPPRNVVMFSGGIGSWATAKRVAEEQGTDGLVLLFADTLVEDVDTYRFLSAAARNVGGELVRVADGRTPFEVFKDERYLGNARLAPCSKLLKQKPCREWIDAHCDPDRTVLHVGIDWTEQHRLPAILKGWAPYRVTAPMAEPPLRSKDDMIAWARAQRLTPPRAYAAGYPHANCLAQGCVRGGQAYWRLLLRDRPEIYAKTEQAEQDIQEHLGSKVTMLKDRRGGWTSPLSLRGFREQIELAPAMFDTEEWGGCGCFTDAEAA